MQRRTIAKTEETKEKEMHNAHFSPVSVQHLANFRPVLIKERREEKKHKHTITTPSRRVVEELSARPCTPSWNEESVEATYPHLAQTGVGGMKKIKKVSARWRLVRGRRSPYRRLFLLHISKCALLARFLLRGLKITTRIRSTFHLSRKLTLLLAKWLRSLSSSARCNKR
eukprot:gb/GEZN01010992.1/.p2 GENE.gb/GEZN01010992.1/~~gb/GEZN01010992.1/.p2  ORF type:complete len:170 (+),score=25.60 gb/GEZN01010992.1/:608-1117(+)